MNLVFVGKQGSGKGTEAKIIAEKLNLQHISTGDLLRQAEGELRKEIDSYILKGNLVPDELILIILEKRIEKEDCNRGIILDGYPRNLKQAEMLDKIIKIDKVIDINISNEIARKRLNGRWNCNKCGSIYNSFTEPKPKILGICNKCKGKLSQREDDIDEALINKRLEIYRKDTSPILTHYKNKLIKIDGSGSVEEVTEKILEVLD